MVVLFTRVLSNYLLHNYEENPSASVEMKIFNELKRFNGDRKGMEKKFYQKLNVKRESVGIK